MAEEDACRKCTLIICRYQRVTAVEFAQGDNHENGIPSSAATLHIVHVHESHQWIVSLLQRLLSFHVRSPRCVGLLMGGLTAKYKLLQGQRSFFKY